MKPDFLITPYQLIIDNKLTPLDRTVYSVIYWIERLKEGRCSASNDYIAEVANTSGGSVANSISKLATLGYIEVTYKDKDKRVRLNINSKITFSNKIPYKAKTYSVNQNYSKIELEILRFLEKQESVKSPEAYLGWIKKKYGDKDLKKLLNLNFYEWVDHLEHWNPPRVGSLT